MRYAAVRHLPYFMVVAQEVHFHRAAEILHITQSALSRRIQALEQELGGKLFNRGPRGVTLTELGRGFYNDVRLILANLDSAVVRVRALVRGDEGHLRIALNEGALRCPVVTRTLADYQRMRARVKLELVPMLTEDQVVGLNNQILDGGFLYELPAARLDKPGYSSRQISREILVLAVPTSHPLASRRRISPTDLANQPVTWPARDRGRNLYDLMISEFQRYGVTPQISMAVTNAETTIDLAASGLGMGFVGESAHVPPSVTLIRVEGFNVALHLHFVWRSESPSPTLLQFLQLLDVALQEDTSPRRITT